MIYHRGDQQRQVTTEAIGNWLRLASQLDEVKIDAWKFAGSDGFYCESAADRYDSDTSHYTEFSTELTRFIFICNALEEIYRFFVQNYDLLPNVQRMAENKRLREPSMKAAFLIDLCHDKDLPLNFSHYVARLDKAYAFYRKKFSPHMTGMEGVKPDNVSYGLHLVRNLRNHVAHGVFPLIENPEYDGDDERTRPWLIELLKQACRVSALNIQLLLTKHHTGFNSYEYDQVIGAVGGMFKRFLKNCTPKYGRSLHTKARFSFENWISYDDGD